MRQTRNDKNHKLREVVRNGLAQGMSQAAIGRLWGVSRQRIWQVVRELEAAA